MHRPRIAGRVGMLVRALVAEPTYLSAEEQRQVLLELARQQARLEALQLKVLAAADRNDVGAESGASSTGAWLSHMTLADRPEVVGRVKLARALDDRHPTTLQGLAAGDYSTAHAAVIVKALADLPEDLDPDLVVRGEKTLVEEAAHLAPWAKGGRTDLDNGILLCGHHHRLAHHPDYAHGRQPNGDIRYHRRT